MTLPDEGSQCLFEFLYKEVVMAIVSQQSFLMLLHLGEYSGMHDPSGHDKRNFESLPALESHLFKACTCHIISFHH